MNDLDKRDWQRIRAGLRATANLEANQRSAHDNILFSDYWASSKRREKAIRETLARCKGR